MRGSERESRPRETSYAKKFSGKYSHRAFKGIGHNVPQEARHAGLCQGIVDVDG
jgi:hypothetical protein